MFGKKKNHTVHPIEANEEVLIQISEPMEITKKTTRWAISKMPFNSLAKPDFISCNFNSLPLPQKKVKDKALLAWTLTSKEDYEKIKDKCDNIIYELFTPTF